MARERKEEIILVSVVLAIALVFGVTIQSNKARIKSSGANSGAVGQGGGFFSREARQNVNAKQKATTEPKGSQLPRYPVPILLSKKQEEVTNQIGAPNSTWKASHQIGNSWWDNGKVRWKTEVTLSWTYEKKPYTGYTMVLRYNPVMSDNFANVRVHDVSIFNGYLRGMPVAEQILPDALLDSSPSAYFYRGALIYNPLNQLAIAWHYQGNSYVAVVSSESLNFVTEERVVNTATGEVSRHYNLNSNGENWKNFQLTSFYQVVGSPSYKKLFDRGDAMSGFVQIK